MRKPQAVSSGLDSFTQPSSAYLLQEELVLQYNKCCTGFALSLKLEVYCTVPGHDMSRMSRSSAKKRIRTLTLLILCLIISEDLNLMIKSIRFLMQSNQGMFLQPVSSNALEERTWRFRDMPSHLESLFSKMRKFSITLRK